MRALLLFLSLFFVVSICNAYDPQGKHIEGRIHGGIKLNDGTSIEGEVIDYRKGNLSWEVKDITVPGNGGMDIEVWRHFNGGEYHEKVMEDWNVSLPRIIMGTSPNGVTVHDAFGLSEYFDSEPGEGGWGLEDDGICSFPELYGSSNLGMYIFLSQLIGLAEDWGQIDSSSARNIQSLISFLALVLNANFFPEDYNTGLQLHIPGQGSKELLLNTNERTYHGPYRFRSGTAANADFVTSDNWLVHCLEDSRGKKNHFQVTSPQGTVYTFDKVSKAMGEWVLQSQAGQHIVYPSSIVDKNNNRLDLSYYRDTYVCWIAPWGFGSPGSDQFKKMSYGLYPVCPVNYRIKAISGDDNRTVSFIYEDSESGKRINEIHANGSIWEYKYDDSPTHESSYRPVHLSEVVLPDDTSWNYEPLSASEHNEIDGFRVGDNVLAGTFGYLKYEDGRIYPETGGLRLDPHHKRMKSVTTPQGLKITYGYEMRDAKFFEDTTSDIAEIATLKTRVLSGSGIPTSTWSYSYTKSGDNGYTTITMPNTSDGRSASQRITYDLDFDGDHFGLPVEVEFRSGGIAIRRETTEYRTLGLIGEVERVLERPRSVNVLRTVERKTIRQSASDFTTVYSNFDKFGNPRTVVETGESYFDRESGSQVTPSRTFNMLYQNNEADWILGSQTSVKLLNSGNGDIENSSVFDELGQLEEQTANGITRYFSYHPKGDLKEEWWFQDGQRFTKRYENYKCGIAQKEFHPDGVVLDKSVNDRCKIEWEEDGNNHRVSYEHNDMGNITKESYVFFDPKVTIWNLNDNPRVSRITESDKQITRTTDALGNTIREEILDLVSGEATYTRKRFDIYGQEIESFNISSSDAETQSITSQFDLLGRNTSSVDQNGVIRTNCYSESCVPSGLSGPNRAGRLITVSTLHVPVGGDVSGSVSSNVVNVTESMAYGSPDNSILIDDYKAVSETESLQHRWTHYKYLKSGEVTEISFGGMNSVDRISRVHEYFPNTSLLQKVIREDIGEVTYTYYENGQVKTLQNNARTPITYLRDGHGREIYIDADNSDGSPDVSFGYDYNGNVKWADNGYARWDYLYNGLNLTESATFTIDGREFYFDYEWLPNKNMYSMQYPNGETVLFEYDGLGRMTDIGDYASQIKYYPTDVVDSFVYGNDLTYKATFNNANSLESIAVRKGLNELVYENYQYNFMNHIYQKVTEVGEVGTRYTNSYRYNPNGFIRSGTSYNSPVSYQYDALGNISSKSEEGHSVTISYRNYADTNSVGLLVDGVTSSRHGSRNFQYDDLGNVSDNGINTLEFSASNSLLGVPNLGINYYYDSNGYRVATSTPEGNEITIRNNNGNTLAKYDLATNKVTNYVYLANSLLAANEVDCSECESFGTLFPRTDDVDRSEQMVADLSVDVTSGELVGFNYVFTIEIKNAGPSVAEETVFNQTMPDGVTIVDWSITQGDCVIHDENDVTCYLGDLQNQDVVEFTGTMGGLSKDDLYKQATSVVFSATYDPNIANNVLVESNTGGCGGPCASCTAARDTIGTEYLANMRVFRDEVLSHSKLGREFIASYYDYSPSVVALYEKNDAVKWSVQGMFFSALLVAELYANPLVLGFGILMSLLLVGLVVYRPKWASIGLLGLFTSVNTQAGVTYFHHDNVQSVVMVTDENGDEVWTKRYTPFGEENHTGADTEKEQGFGGHQHDYETSFVYMKARYYDPLVGRFLSVDPKDIGENSAASVNSYQYSANSPIGLSDPDGNEVQTATSTVFPPYQHVGVFARPDASWELAMYRPDIFTQLQIQGGVFLFDAQSQLANGVGWLVPRADTALAHTGLEIYHNGSPISGIGEWGSFRAHQPAFESLTYDWSSDSESIMRMYDRYQLHSTLSQSNPVFYNGFGQGDSYYQGLSSYLNYNVGPTEGLFQYQGFNSNNAATWYLQAGGIGAGASTYYWAPSSGSYGTSLQPYSSYGNFGGSLGYTGYSYGGYSSF